MFMYNMENKDEEIPILCYASKQKHNTLDEILKNGAILCASILAAKVGHEVFDVIYKIAHDSYDFSDTPYKPFMSRQGIWDNAYSSKVFQMQIKDLVTGQFPRNDRIQEKEHYIKQIPWVAGHLYTTIRAGIGTFLHLQKKETQQKLALLSAKLGKTLSPLVAYWSPHNYQGIFPKKKDLNKRKN